MGRKIIALAWGLAVACGSGDSVSSRRADDSASPANPASREPSAGPQAIDNGPRAAGSGSAPLTPPPTAAGGSSDSNVCEVVHLVANPQTPDMMIVLDRSGSMEEGGRWQPSVSAVRRITTELQAKIQFGLALFPDPAALDPNAALTQLMQCINQPDPQQCLDMITALATNAVCAPGKIVVPIAASNAGPIGMQLDMTQPNGGTPTSDTLDKLLDEYALAETGPDIERHAKFVLLVTDGLPTCPAGAGDQTTQPDIDASNAAIEALTARQVKTYVVGYDTSGPGNEQLATVLDGFAQRGGTGDRQHRPVEDEASLLGALQSITAAIASCSFSLDKAPRRADYVLVRLDGAQVNLGSADGWQLIGDRTIELVGAACQQFRSGLHTLSAEVQCDVVVPS
jgi:hypothetical protein